MFSEFICFSCLMDCVKWILSHGCDVVTWLWRVQVVYVYDDQVIICLSAVGFYHPLEFPQSVKKIHVPIFKNRTQVFWNCGRVPYRGIKFQFIVHLIYNGKLMQISVLQRPSFYLRTVTPPKFKQNNKHQTYF
jgi:hypothetical protein